MIGLPNFKDYNGNDWITLSSKNIEFTRKVENSTIKAQDYNIWLSDIWIGIWVLIILLANGVHGLPGFANENYFFIFFKLFIHFSSLFTCICRSYIYIGTNNCSQGVDYSSALSRRITTNHLAFTFTSSGWTFFLIFSRF